jgi:hypothetical protein
MKPIYMLEGRGEFEGSHVYGIYATIELALISADKRLNVKLADWEVLGDCYCFTSHCKDWARLVITQEWLIETEEEASCIKD